MDLSSFCLFVLLFSGGARRSHRIDDSHRDAQHRHNMLTNSIEVSAEVRESLLPVSFKAGVLRRGGREAYKCALARGPLSLRYGPRRAEVFLQDQTGVGDELDPEKVVWEADAGRWQRGKLVNTYVADEAERKKLVSECVATIEVSMRQACDVAALITGALSPLTGFMNKTVYDSVVSKKCLIDGTPFSLPVVLDIKEANLQGKKILLKYQGTDLAVMDVEEQWKPDKKEEVAKWYGTAEGDHPTVLGEYYAGGKIYGLIKSYNDIRGKVSKSPSEVRATSSSYSSWSSSDSSATASSTDSYSSSSSSSSYSSSYSSSSSSSS